MEKKHSKTPFIDALGKYVEKGVTPFDVPGHHMGGISTKLSNLVSPNLYKFDVNAPYGLDNLAHPHSVIKQSEDLFAKSFNADHSLFLINGTSSGIIASIVFVLKSKDKIIIPRNIHKSVHSAIILSGASPIYVNPKIDKNLGIANQPTVDDYKKKINQYPSAKAIFVINPTYFGVVLDLQELVNYAHSKGVIVICDEAHGAYFYYPKSPIKNAMDCGADISIVSTHKTGGSLTQSSVLLVKEGLVNFNRLKFTLNMLNTTSPNSLLIASIEAARDYMDTEGLAARKRINELIMYAHEQLKGIKGFTLKTRDYFIENNCKDFDSSRLVIELDNLKVTGYDLFEILSRDYHIQIELAEQYVMLMILSLGSTKEHIDNLSKALRELSAKYYYKNSKIRTHHLDLKNSFAIMTPRTAFNAPGKMVPLKEALNHISKEMIMVYPPGIPFLTPGEVFTQEIIEAIQLGIKEKSNFICTNKTPDYVEIIDETNWKKFDFFKKKLSDFAEHKLTIPKNDGCVVPLEAGPHTATFIEIPFRRDVWRDYAKPAVEEFLNVIESISKFEKVIVGTSKKDYKLIKDRLIENKNVEVIKVPYNDSWARDNSLIFTKAPNGQIRGINFNFNAWGGKYDGLYSNFLEDQKLGSNLAKYLKIPLYSYPDFVLEGGSITTNGEGLLITTKECLLSKGRNPTYSQKEIEEILKNTFNVNEIIWLPYGLVGDETNGHVDNICTFVNKNTVLLCWTEDKKNKHYKVVREAYNKLSKYISLNKESLNIIKIPLPSTMIATEEESKLFDFNNNAKPRLAGDELLGSYVNLYQGNKFVIVPSFNVKEDKEVLNILSKVFKGKKIIPVYSREILLGGGNIHCITMQIPK